jgi:acyl-CoA thioester hydrolase
MQDTFKFTTKLNVRINEINYGGHLGNDSFLSLFQEGRLRYLKQFGWSELTIGEDTSLIMSQAHINFKAEAFWGERLKILVRISKVEKIRFTFEYQIESAENEKKIVATGYTDMVGFDYHNKKIKKLPEIFVNKIRQYENID